MNYYKNSLIFCLIMCFFPLFLAAQGIKTKGKIHLKGRGCVKVYVRGNANFSSQTTISKNINLQITDSIQDENGKKIIIASDCEPPNVNGCQIFNKIGENWIVSINNKDIGLLKIQFFNLYGQVIYEQKTQKTTPFWYERIPIENYANGTIIAKVSINNKLLCTQKLGKIQQKCLFLYPNPTHKEINFYFENDTSLDTISYQITDMVGRVLLYKKNEIYTFQNNIKDKYHATWKVDLASLRLVSGVYILQVFGNNFACSEKFIIP